MNLCEKQSTKCSYPEFKNRLKNLIVTNGDQLCGIKQGLLGGRRGMESVDSNIVWFNLIYPFIYHFLTNPFTFF